MKKSKTLTVWASGAVLMVSVGVVAGWQVSAGAAPATTTSSQPQVLPFAASGDGNGSGKGTGNNGKGGGNGAGTGSPGKGMEVTHQLVGAVAPGGNAILKIRVVNPNPQNATITAVTGQISSIVSAPGEGDACTLNDFKQPVYTGALGQTVPADRKGHIDLELRLEMRNTNRNQDRCKDADFDYSFLVTANQA